ncbi:hypothetical protein IEO21_06930 [Rhodonia placenta]|uniref:Uncharacterized protein n=1 Tax=Rhodonia placenta TaxID=104341 RepID=A0A8H7NYZ8_9APHY|nr:hypothetical protein IEO21_06930 [Postia placenta]
MGKIRAGCAHWSVHSWSMHSMLMQSGGASESEQLCQWARAVPCTVV